MAGVRPAELKDGLRRLQERPDVRPTRLKLIALEETSRNAAVGRVMVVFACHRHLTHRGPWPPET